MILRTTIDTPLGPLMVFAGDAGVVRTVFVEDGPSDGAILDATEDRRKAAPIRREVEAYFGGVLRTFETPADLSETGDGFVRRVLETVRTIPYGQMWTYGDVAAASGGGAARGRPPRAPPAAGSALARCPIELFVPCHRVVRAGPGLGSYGRHDERRRFLLRLEGALTDASSVP
jgi:methylated-DNA-[protein]-cysteine S-methyltransferase